MDGAADQRRIEMLHRPSIQEVSVKRIFGVPIVPLVAVLAAGTAVAQPKPQTLTGGVGVEERAQMMQRYDEYNFHLAFAQPDGQYLAGVKVTARDANGSIVLSDFADGPFLFANLPPGTYRVTAALAGDAKTRAIRIGNGAAPIHYFRWDAVADTSTSR
jgi:hypothetical protein